MMTRAIITGRYAPASFAPTATKREFGGAAPGCTLVAVRAFAGADLIHEARLAAAIRYATSVAHVILCSWTGEDHGVVIQAFEDTRLGRGNKGTGRVLRGRQRRDGRRFSSSAYPRHRGWSVRSRV